MKMFKKYTTVLTTIIGSSLVLTACGGGTAPTNTGTTATPAAATAAAAKTDGPKLNFRLAETHPADYPTTIGDKKFAELVNQASGGRIKIDVFPSSQLGEEKAVIEQVQLGAIEFTRVSTGALGGFNKQYEVFSLPYIFDNDEHQWRFLESEQGTKLLDSLESSRMKGLAYYSSGARHFYTKKPVKSIADLKGLKIRVIQNKVNIDLMNALGANATPMPYGDVFNALQTGIIDAAENNYPSYFSSNHFQQAKNLILDQHQRVPEVLLISKVAWDKLSADDKALIKKAALDSVKTQKEEWAKFEKDSEAKVRAAGVTITEVSDLKPWQEAVKPVIDKYRNDYKETLEAIEKAKK
ncbi:TRAP transporter substrate-binding protein [Paenibacillus sedimenti]|uniref:TRAP transporter substrate-binding protein n=1 Tax=Paenibacillus sedimenti TaxID=2770274 RepID=A0A926QHY7_9BACL|nr:TRAP transporter substrate-binding protein [Paenibacillus sedimenti]MBD0379014.1 TRAP transporter substrate-binding protein [Paenibacillus sedimenti]